MKKSDLIGGGIFAGLAETRFRIAGNLDLPRDHEVQRKLQFPGNLQSHGNPARRNGEDQRIGPNEGGNSLGQEPARVGPVLEYVGAIAQPAVFEELAHILIPEGPKEVSGFEFQVPRWWRI